MLSEYLHELRAELDAELDRMVRSTGIGAATDWADYRYRVGIATGFKRALEKANELFKTFNESED